MVYRLPPGYIFRSDPAGGHTKADPVIGAKFIQDQESSHRGSVYDVRELFEAQGITFPQGSEAFFFSQGGVLFVKNTSENLDLIETLGPACTMSQPTLLRHEFAIVTFKVDALSLTQNPPTLDEIRKAAGDTWKQVGTLEIVGKSGMVSKGICILDKEPQTETNETNALRAPELPPHTKGLACSVESTLGPDGYTIDSRISFRSQLTRQGTNSPLVMRFDGGSTLRDGQPQVLQCITEKGGELTSALVLRITVALPDSR